jgi:cytochrome P450
MSILGSHAIRIAPNELHLSDPKLYKTIYSSGQQYPKAPIFYKGFGPEFGLFTTTDIAAHKIIRRRLAPSLSHSSAARAQPLMVDTLRQLALKFEARGYDKSINVYNWCRCFPADVIVKLVFGSSDVLANCNEDFEADISTAFDATASTTWLRAYYPNIRLLQDLIPLGLGALFIQNVRKVKGFLDMTDRHIKSFRSDQNADNDHKSEPLLNAIKDLPEEHLLAHAGNLIAGGSDTTGYTLSFAIWNLLQQPALAARLVAELDTLFDDAAPAFPSLAILEAAPTLNSIVLEALRCGLAVPGRLPRTVARNATALEVDGRLVPSGTTVGMSAYTMHMDTEVFGADAATFNPERWTTGMAKPANLVIFSKGERNCIGQSLAMAELHTGLAFIFRRFDIRLVGGPCEWKQYDRFTAAGEPFWAKMSPRREDTFATA